MRKVKYYCQLAGFLLGLLTSSLLWATPLETSRPYAKAEVRNLGILKIGEPILVPITIKKPQQWESAIFEFKVKSSSVAENPIQIHNQLIFGAHKGSDFFTAYVPIVVKGEGFLDVIYKITLTQADGSIDTIPWLRKLKPELAKLFPEEEPIGFGGFSFNGIYVVGDDSGFALYNLVYHNRIPLVNADKRYREVQRLQEKAYKAFNKAMFDYDSLTGAERKELMEIYSSTKEKIDVQAENEMKLLFDKERDKILDEFYNKYPTLKNKN